jgi:hypothetical protein
LGQISTIHQQTVTFLLTYLWGANVVCCC